MNPLRDTKIALFVLPAILLFFYSNAAMHFRYTPDDTYIYLQFARNVVNGDGISFNPGHPVYGITGPAWMALIAVGGLFHIDLLLAAKLIDLFIASMALMMFFFVAFEVIHDTLMALMASLAFAINVWFLRWAGTGMETSLSVLLLLTALWFTLRNEYFLAVVFTAILGMVRPEGWLFLPMICVDLFVNSVDRRRGWKMIGAMVLIFAALITPWLVYASVTFGSFLPNTAFAKSTPGFQVRDVLDTVSDITRTLILSDGISGTVMVLGLMFLWWRSRAGALSDAEHDANFVIFRSSMLTLGWAALLAAVYCLNGVNVVSRYLLLISPVLVINAFSFFNGVTQFRASRGRALIGATILTAAIMLQNQVSYVLLVKPGIERFQQGMEECFIPIGKWLNRNTLPGTVVFAQDIGALGYFSQREICDAAGLVSAQPLAYLRSGGVIEDMYRNKLYLRWGADYVVHRAHVPQALADQQELQPLFYRAAPQLDLAAREPMYYTVYKVISHKPIQGKQ